MDIKAKITELVDKIKGDKDLLEKFKKDPKAAVKGLIGIDVPDDALEKIVDGVKAKISVDKAGDILGKIKKLF